MQRSKIALFLLFFGLASLCHAETAMVPLWLPADQRFEVEGTSNEIAQVDHTLALMRDALHPKLKAQMKPEDLGPTLNWIVHVSLPAMTNETAYFDSYKKPLSALSLNRNLLTNRAARLSTVPLSTNLKFAWQQKAEPGVDYPGVAYEDDGSTSSFLRFTFRAPQRCRNLKVKCSANGNVRSPVEFKWVKMNSNTSYSGVMVESHDAVSELVRMRVIHPAKGHTNHLWAVFAREDGGFWGCPAFISAARDPLCCHCYGADGKVERIEYGKFTDWYKFDDKDHIVGFSRILEGNVTGCDYSNVGERIIEAYPGDAPKITHKVKYFVKDGELCFKELDNDIHYKNSIVEFRAYK